MKRYPPFDPPEYVGWEPIPAAGRGVRRAAGGGRGPRSLIEALDEAALLSLYAGLVRTRVHDVMLKRWVRQGVLSKAWLGTGEEAVTVGCVHALDRERDVVAPMIRNAGALMEMGMPLDAVFHGLFATATSPTGGRDLHFGDLSHGVLQPISHVGDMVPGHHRRGAQLPAARRAAGRADVGGRRRDEDGGVPRGDQPGGGARVPAIFVIQNNQVALGTRLDQHQAGRLPALAEDVRDGGRVRRRQQRAGRVGGHAAGGGPGPAGGGPTLLVVETFRMGGHATHDEAEARRTFPAELFEHWGRRDPVGLYEEYLAAGASGGIGWPEVEREVTAEVEAAAERVRAEKA
jgi:2-oxoisovalerate dehydrogenase E1 component